MAELPVVELVETPVAELPVVEPVETPESALVETPTENSVGDPSRASLASRSACLLRSRGTQLNVVPAGASRCACAASGFMSGCLIFQRPDICSTTSLESIRTSSAASGVCCR